MLNEIDAVYEKNLKKRLDNSSQFFLIFLIISIVLVFFSFFILIPFYNFVNLSQRELIKIFLEIPIEKIKFLNSQCENFLTHMQVKYKI